MTYPTIMPALTLDFANSRQLDPRITFSRTSGATYLNPDTGLITLASDHEARFEKEGLLIEESRTNSNYPSNDLLDSRYTISPDYSTSYVVAPDGSNDAVYFAETVGQNSLYINPTPPSTTHTSATGSVYVKLIGNRQYFAIRQVVASNNFVRATFDVANESYKFVVGDVDTRSSYSADIKNVGNGWYRCSLTVAYSSAAAIGMYFNPSDSDTGGNVTNSGFGGPTNTAIANSGMVLWGYQLEAGSFASSLIPTSGSTVTRSADIAQMTGDNFSSWYNQSEGTILTNVKYLGLPDNAVLNTAFSLQTGTSSPRTILVAYGVNSRMRVLADTSGDIYPGDTFNTTELRKCVVGYKTNDLNLTVNGSNLGTDTSYTTGTSINRLVLDTGNGGSPCSKHISRLTYYNQRLTDAELQTLTS